MVVGCLALSFEPGHPSDVPRGLPREPVTFAKDIAPIVYHNCASCHRPSGVAPFSLIGYENARKWIPTMATVTKSHLMPPWKAAAGYGEFSNENRLSPEQISMFEAWYQEGSPRGDKSKEPPEPKFASTWPLRQPDLIVQPEKPFNVDAEGEDVYRSFVMKNKFTHPVWVKAFAVKPGNPRVVHHVIVYLDATGEATERAADNKDGQEGYETHGGGPGFIPSVILGAWAAGSTVCETPQGVAYLIKPGYTLVMQVHYHKTGKVEEDRTQLGLYFAKEPIHKEMANYWIINAGINIPPGEDHHIETQDEPVDQNITIYSVMPHMHLLGRSMRAYAEFPNGTRKPLIWVPDWDFNWQMSYVLKRPMHVPKGSQIHIEAVYDNSANNPRNPHRPPKPVKFGSSSDAEMFLLIVGLTEDGA